MIPEAAVEAAVEAHREGTMLAALEAAVPHLLAGLRAELMKLAQEFDGASGGTLAYTINDGRFAMRKNAHDQLMYIVNRIGPAIEEPAASLLAEAWDEGSIAGWMESGLPHSWNAENALRSANPYRPAP